jgi:hypothetical protein
MREGVREGDRYAITGQDTTGPSRDDSIQYVVKQYAPGFRNSAPAASTIHVQFANPDTGGHGANANGNRVNVKIEGLTYQELAPFENLNKSRYLFAEASGMREPLGGASPPLRNPSD